MKKQRIGATTVIVIAALLTACGGATDESGDLQPPSESAPAQTDSESAQVPADSDDNGGSQDTTASLPEGFPTEMPLPEGAQYSFRAGVVEYFYINRPVAAVIDELEALLPAHGWDVIEVVNGVAWVDDQLFEVEGHGLQLFVYAEPSAGSETETSLSIGAR